MLNVVMLSVIRLNAVMLNVVMLSVLIIKVVILSVVMLNVVVLNVMAPPISASIQPKIDSFCQSISYSFNSHSSSEMDRSIIVNIFLDAP
jgi:hypothetical protein